VGWIGAAAALLGARRARGESRGSPGDGPVAQPAVLPQAALLALAEGVLPREIGVGGAARISREFTRWLSEYRPNAEILHSYGSGDLSWTGPSPAGRWRAQLGDLETAARKRFGQGWTSLGIPERQTLIRQALEASVPAGLPSPQRASHVAVALMSFYFGSPEATDLCYGVHVGRNQCRPLVHNAREPLPLARRGQD
jgi:hypothetical protein